MKLYNTAEKALPVRILLTQPLSSGSKTRTGIRFCGTGRLSGITARPSRNQLVV